MEMLALQEELNRFLDLTEQDRVSDYLTVLRETNIHVKKLVETVDFLNKELRKERDLRSLAETTLLKHKETASANISRHLFNTYMVASREREATQEEWVSFIQNFKFTEESKLHSEIYVWIDTHVTPA